MRPALILLILTLTLAAPTLCAADAAAFDPDPAHLWNRLHRALFTRTAHDGRTFKHEIDPLFWPTTKHLLIEPSHQRAIEVLDEFIQKDGEKLIADSLKRALLQRDLWALFDWNAWHPDEWVRFAKHEPASKALRERLVKLIQRLALTEAEIRALPDNYALAVASKTYAQERGDPSLPVDLLVPHGPWVLFSHDFEGVPVHTKAFGGRSVFFAFLNLPAGRKATEEYLRNIKREPANIPLGTRVALVRRAVLIDTNGKLVASNLTESVQVRVYVKDPARIAEEDRHNPGNQIPFEFTLNRAELFANRAGGLLPTGKEHSGFNFLPGVNGGEPFEPANDGAVRDPQREMRNTMTDCMGCHGAIGIKSVLSISQILEDRSNRETPQFRAITPDIQMKGTIYFKQKRFDWGLLKGWLESRP